MKQDHPVMFKPESAAEAWLGLLATRGIDYLFANGGTDFAPVVEAYAKARWAGACRKSSWCPTRTSAWRWRTATPCSPAGRRP
jgi:hypothetical protein